ncbi:cyclic nucleotide-binding domain-containing protein [Nocardioides sp. JQ2195]|uniref:Crp/Fnr family transcriptional regulator n=1 Tax=Nocardioides sp. JQ2195 TaxID=2592334 RepID=UPI00143EEB87|nr:cyclic nucleotide-binding domain-containing protein [Nocardioides sp. JQ2195]QIX25966.1 cyclic nucleotide-binding domain-containing protein [Nocardioides sp. JQ2195]
MTHIADKLTARELQQVHAQGTRLTVPQGWSLIWERTPADKAYLIVAGEVTIRRNNVEIARLGPGDVVGEMAIVNHKLRTATVVAATPLEVVHFTSAAVEGLCEQIPAFGEALARTATERLTPA